MSLLKDIYSTDFFNEFIKLSSKIIPEFKKEKFKKAVSSKDFKILELKQRSSFLAVLLNDLMDSNFEKNSKQLLKLCETIKKSNKFKSNFPFIFIPEIYERAGIDHPIISLNAFEKITSLISCEFAIRPFIERHEKGSMQKIHSWTSHSDEHVRRLASEGIRPKLPWASELKKFRQDPKPIIEVLHKLKNDESEYVRRSVANNLNDVSKDHPELLIEILKAWKGANENTDKLLKHASRTLLKQGHTEVMKIFDYGDKEVISIEDFDLKKNKIQFPGVLEFYCCIKNNKKIAINTRLEYGIYFRKANGSLSKKVFKISERKLNGLEEQKIEKKHSLVSISTRKYHEGIHGVSIIINGFEGPIKEFNLKF